MIAQDVEKVFPELVNQTDPKSVNYDGLIGLLIEAVKELKEEVEEPEEKVDILEQRHPFFYIIFFHIFVETNEGPDSKYYGLKYEENGIGCYL